MYDLPNWMFDLQFIRMFNLLYELYVRECYFDMQ